MKEEEPVDGKKSEDDGIEKENLAILEKIRKNQRQDHLNVSAHSLMFFFPILGLVRTVSGVEKWGSSVFLLIVISVLTFGSSLPITQHKNIRLSLVKPCESHLIEWKCVNANRFKYVI